MSLSGDHIESSVADWGCLSRNRDPNVFHPGSRIRLFSVPDPGYGPNNLSILTRKLVCKLSENMIRVVHPGSSFFNPSRIPDPGVKKAPDPGTATLIEREKKFIVKHYADWVLSINCNTYILSASVFS
jgi:hypothetical protein